MAFAINGEVFIWDETHNRKRIGGKFGPIWNNKTKSFSAEGPTDDELETWSERQNDGSMKVTIDEDGDSHTELTYKDGDLTELKRFMAEVFEADRKARRRTTLTWARGIEPSYSDTDNTPNDSDESPPLILLKHPRPYEVNYYESWDYNNSNAYHIGGLPPGYHIHLWKPKARTGWWRVYMKSPKNESWEHDFAKSKKNIMADVLKWYNSDIATPVDKSELTPIQHMMMQQGLLSAEVQIYRVEIPATIQNRIDKITGEKKKKEILPAVIEYYFAGGEDEIPPQLFATYEGGIEFVTPRLHYSMPPILLNFCRGLRYMDAEKIGNVRSVNRYNKDRKQWVASHPAWFQNMCKQGIKNLRFNKDEDGIYKINGIKFLRFHDSKNYRERQVVSSYGLRLPEKKYIKAQGIDVPMFQIWSHKSFKTGQWITPRPSTQSKMYDTKELSIGEREIGIFNKCVAKYQPQEWERIHNSMLQGSVMGKSNGWSLNGSAPSGEIMCRRFKKKLN